MTIKSIVKFSLIGTILSDIIIWIGCPSWHNWFTVTFLTLVIFFDLYVLANQNLYRG